MIKETSNQLKARARGTLLGHYGLPIGASILTTAAIMTLEGLISLVVPKNTAGVLISYRPDISICSSIWPVEKKPG